MTPGMAAKDGSSGGGCPVMHGKGGEGGGKPSGLMGIFGGSRRAADASTPAGSKPEPAASGGCPVMHGGKPPPAASTAAPPAAPGATAPHGADATEEKIYNAYGEEVDPRNQMPAGNQEPWPGQTRRLSTERVPSAIPKTGSDDTWSYPSPQMFYNALKRKGKGDDVAEDEVTTLVAIHNNMNDTTWSMLLEWEQWHIQRGEVAGDTPQLSKFMGRPFDLTPKARVKSWLGYGLPFDRHDWEVDRGDGKGTVRYVIDYYYDNAQSQRDKVPELGMRADPDDIQSIVVDVRPALDSLASVYHRVRRFPARAYESYLRGRPAEPDLAGPGTGYNEEAKAKKERIGGLAPAQAASAQTEDVETAGLKEKVEGKCGALFDAVAACEDEEEKARATVALNYCVSGVVCPSAAKAFMAALEGGADAAAVEATNGAVTSCAEGFFRRVGAGGLAGGAAPRADGGGAVLRQDAV